MNGDRLSAIAATDPGLTEALSQLRGQGLRDDPGPDPIIDSAVSALHLVDGALEATYPCADELMSEMRRAGVQVDMAELPSERALMASVQRAEARRQQSDPL